MIFAGVYGPVDQAIISKNSYLTLNVCVNVINIQEKSVRLRTIPCGTPELTVVNEEQYLSTTTNCVLFWRKYLIHVNRLLLMP